MVRFGSKYKRDNLELSTKPNEKDWVPYILIARSASNITRDRLELAMNHTVTPMGWKYITRIDKYTVKVVIHPKWANWEMVEQLWSFGIGANSFNIRQIHADETIDEIHSINREEDILARRDHLEPPPVKSLYREIPGWVIYYLWAESPADITDERVNIAMNHTVTPNNWSYIKRVGDNTVKVAIKPQWDCSDTIEQLRSFNIYRKTVKMW